jgi:dihydrofolate reductase
MRTVTFGMNISLDGYCDHTIFNPNAELMDYFTGMMDDVDLLFFGRVMYQLMFPYWSGIARDQSGTPDQNRFAERLTAIDKVVVSRSLVSDEKNVRIVSKNPSEELLKLKQQAGKKISVDSLSLFPDFIAAMLIDEFNLVIHPVMAGKGRRLLDTVNLQEKLNLKLVDTQLFKNGCVAHQYLRVDNI